MSLNELNVRSVLASLILNKLGDGFVGAKELFKISNNDVNCLLIQHYLSQTSLETLINIREQAKKIPLVANSIKHHLLQVYNALVLYSPNSNEFNRSMIFILFILEVCHQCVQLDRSSEIRSIHEFTSRFLIQQKKSLESASVNHLTKTFGNLNV